MLPAGSLDSAGHRCGPMAVHPRMASHLVVEPNWQVDTAGLVKGSHKEEQLDSSSCFCSHFFCGPG